VWNRSRGATDALVARGAQDTDSVVTALQFAEVTMICVLDQAATREILAVDGAQDALAGRTLVQFSSGSPDDAAALEEWSLRAGARFLQGSIKGYPRDIGPSTGLITYAGSRATFDDVNDTLRAFGKAVHVGESVAVASALADADGVMYEIAVAAFFELAAYVTAHGAEAGALAKVMASTLRAAAHTAQHSVELLEAGALDGDEASIDVHASGVRTAVEAIARTGHDPRLTRATLSYLEDAQKAGLGQLDIAALLTTVGRPVVAEANP
jgi:3-hydroxyisobutyrate dehydrogenase-like beta-hydroxyacid dehydrogenase